MATIYTGHKPKWKWKYANPYEHQVPAKRGRGFAPITFKETSVNKSGQIGNYYGGQTLEFQKNSQGTWTLQDYHEGKGSWQWRGQVARALQFAKFARGTGKLARFARALLRNAGIYGQALDIALQLAGEVWTYTTPEGTYPFDQYGFTDCGWNCGLQEEAFRVSTAGSCSGIYHCLAGQTFTGPVGDPIIAPSAIKSIFLGQYNGLKNRITYNRQFLRPSGQPDVTIPYRKPVYPIPVETVAQEPRPVVTPGPSWEVHTGVGTGPQPRNPKPKYVRPPKTKTKEVKLVIRDPALAKLYGSITEIGDLLGCVKQNMRKGSKGDLAMRKAKGVHEKALAWFYNMADVDYAGLTKCVVLNEIQDRAIGSLNMYANRAVVNSGLYRSPVGIGRGGFAQRMR